MSNGIPPPAMSNEICLGVVTRDKIHWCSIFLSVPHRSWTILLNRPPKPVLECENLGITEGITLKMSVWYDQDLRPKPIIFQLFSVRGWTSAFLLDVHRLCGAIEGRVSHFVPHWFRMGWHSVISQGKIPGNIWPWLGIEPESLRGQTMRYWAIIADCHRWELLAGSVRGLYLLLSVGNW